MSLFQELRLLAFVRRIAKALELQNKMQAELLRLEHRRGPSSPRPPRKVELDVASVDDWNKLYRDSHPEEDSDGRAI